MQGIGIGGNTGKGDEGMSSTNRGYDRHRSDYYVTPIEEIIKFIESFHEIEPDWAWGKKILDPCAGGDKQHPMSYPEALCSCSVVRNNILTNDIRMDSRAEIRQDYFELDFKNMFDVIMTNPPFKISREIIEKALIDAKDNGYVIMLLRLNYFGSKGRFDMWTSQLPKYCFVHHQRMSFTDNGNTDSIEYCHMVWQKSYYPDYTRLKVI